MNKEFIRKNLFAIITLIFTILFFISVFTYCDSKKELQSGDTPTLSLKIGILRTDNEDKSEKIYNSFINACDALANENENINIDITYLNSAQSEETSRLYASEIAASDCDGILAIGSKAADYIKQCNSEIPVIFAGVKDPEKEGLVASNTEPGGNMTGISDYTPCFEQIGLIRELYPDCKTAAIIYNVNDENSVLQFNIAKYQAQELNLELNEFAVSDFSTLDKILERASSDSEIIYLADDIQINNSIEQICSYFTDKNIPVIGSTETMVKAGCLATYVIDFKSIGEKAALMLLDIIINKRDIAAMPVVYNTDCSFVFNWPTAKSINYFPKGIVLLKAMGYL